MKQKLLFLLMALLSSAMTWAAVGDYFNSGNVKYYVTSESPNEVKVDGYVNTPSGTVDIPETVKNGSKTYTVTAIGYRAFFNCSNITRVYIPATVTSIGQDAFYNCTKVTDVYCYADPSKMTWNEGGCDDFKKSKATICHVFSAAAWASFTQVNVTFESLEVGDTFTVGQLEYQLISSSKVTVYLTDENPVGDFVIPSTVGIYTVSAIDREAFSSCKKMTSVTIPATVTSIARDAFYGCTGVTDVYCYAELSMLSWDDYGNDDFKTGKATKCHVKEGSGWRNFSSVNVTFVCDLYDVGDTFTVDGVTYRVTSTEPKEVEVYDGRTVKDKLIIPNYVNAVEGAEVLPTESNYKVTRIGNGAFRYGQLTEIIVNVHATSIGDEAFYQCGGLIKVDIQDTFEHTGMKTIGNKAFYGCPSLKSINIPHTVTSIGADAFLNCESMSDVYCLADPTALTWAEDGDDFLDDMATKCHVVNAAAWSGFGNVNVTFVGDLEHVTLTDGVEYNRMSTLNGEELEHPSVTFLKTLGEDRVGKYQAWMMPFNYIITEDDLKKFQFYKINMIANAPAPGEGSASGEMWVFLTKLGQGDYLYENMPYVYKPLEAVTNYPFIGGVLWAMSMPTEAVLTLQTAEDEYNFYATYENTTATTGKPFYYVNINGGLSYGDKVTVGPYRWIIRKKSKSFADNIIYYAPMRFFDGEEDIATEIDSMEDGGIQMEEDVWCTLSGVKLNGKPSEKGVYLVNGKKVVIQ